MDNKSSIDQNEENKNVDDKKNTENINSSEIKTLKPGLLQFEYSEDGKVLYLGTNPIGGLFLNSDLKDNLDSSKKK